MRQGGQKLARIRQQLLTAAKPGTTGLVIEALAQKLIKQAGGQASFATVDKYQWATCININAGVVHGVPNNYQFKTGDLVSIDVGIYYQGFHTDCSTTIMVGAVPSGEKAKFLQTGRQVLKKAIAQARPGKRVGHISRTIESNLHAAGYQPLPNLTGHGIGRQLHEPPHIPGVVRQPIKETPQLQSGMTVAIEVIYALGNSDTRVSPEDHWTVISKDGKITAIFEETIAIKNDGPLILTTMSGKIKQ